MQVNLFYALQSYKKIEKIPIFLRFFPFLRIPGIYNASSLLFPGNYFSFLSILCESLKVTVGYSQPLLKVAILRKSFLMGRITQIFIRQVSGECDHSGTHFRVAVVEVVVVNVGDTVENEI